MQQRISVFLTSLFTLFILATPLSSHAAFFAPDYAAQWVSQTQSSTSDQFFYVEPGEIVDFTAQFKNIGKKTWHNSGNEQVTFAIYKDTAVHSSPLFTGFDNPWNTTEFGQSFFRDTSWVSQYRVASLQEAEVKPGATGTINMKFTVPIAIPSGCYREDVSMAAGPLWMSNPINGDPLKVAHIWAGFCVDKETEDFENHAEELVQAFIDTQNKVKKAHFTSTLALEIQGDPSKLDFAKDLSEATQKKIQSIAFSLLGLSLSGQIDNVKEDMQADVTININVKVNGQLSSNWIKGSFILLTSEKKVYFSLTDYDLPLLSQLASTEDDVQEILSFLQSNKGKWFFISSPDDEPFPSSPEVKEEILDVMEQYPIFYSTAPQEATTIEGLKATLWSVSIHKNNFGKLLDKALTTTVTADEEETSTTPLIPANEMDRILSIFREFRGKFWITNSDNIIRKQEYAMTLSLPDNIALNIHSQQTLTQINQPITITIPQNAIDLSAMMFSGVQTIESVETVE